MFITTANMLEPIPGPLQDRMEVLQLSGYTLDEKLHIAKRYLVPRQISENGLKTSQIEFSDAAMRAIVEEYTREAGVRNLERQIGTVCRKIAREVAEGRPHGEDEDLRRSAPASCSGAASFFAEQRRRTREPGVATGLAWTPTGGEVLFVEATAMPGSGNLTITGQLGDVMRESAQAGALLRPRSPRRARPGPARRLVRPAATSTSTSPRARSPRTAPRRGSR